jgi:hypothetical protein
VSDLGKIEFHEPFSLIFDPTNLTKTINEKLKALVCFFFLSAGHLIKLEKNATFAVEFRRACALIRFKTCSGSKPAAPLQLQHGVQEPESSVNGSGQNSENETRPDKQVELPHKRGPEAVPDEPPIDQGMPVAQYFKSHGRVSTY